jgi:hypothetical protein
VDSQRIAVKVDVRKEVDRKNRYFRTYGVKTHVEFGFFIKSLSFSLKRCFTDCLPIEENVKISNFPQKIAVRFFITQNFHILLQQSTDARNECSQN